MSEKISVLISEEDVDKRIREIGETITKDNNAKITCCFYERMVPKV